MAKRVATNGQRPVLNCFNRQQIASLIHLARINVEESLESAAQLRQHYRERRQCRGTTKANKPCRAWALLNCAEQLCAAHFYLTRGPELSHEQRQAREKERSRPTCDCLAYPFPHRPNNGLCRWPLEPARKHVLPAGQRKPGKLRRRKVDTIRKRFGI